MGLKKGTFAFSSDDVLEEINKGGGGGVTMEQVNQAIQTAIADLAKKGDSYTKAEADAKFQPKA